MRYILKVQAVFQRLRMLPLASYGLLLICSKIIKIYLLNPVFAQYVFNFPHDVSNINKILKLLLQPSLVI